ncbi:hypothetical protein QR680_001901 [Steinernema hermaphroditum]|uniref:VWFC domain-containing protein n=1 Tax=Steinernema hermaphroditum TaxID=289476 RepID=A0AA39H0C7_9BILA|nr:hypothetical protein QR680_001901 [Steinernema hermaphroditum]
MARSRTKFELIWLLSTVVLSTVASENHLPSLLSGVQARNLWQLFVDRRVALQFDILQDDNTEGTLISVFQGRTSSRLLFSLTTSTVNNKILLRFRSASDSLKTYTLSAPLNDGQWHKIIVSLQGNRIDLSENCHQLLSKEDDELHFRSVHHPRVYVGQQAHHHNKFQGKMREFSADSSNPVPIRCPNLDLMLDNFVSTKTETPHEGEQEQAVDSAPDQPTSSATENINWNEHVSFMEDQIKQVKLMLQGVDNRLKKVELHQRGCQIAGKIISFGEKQQDPLNCTECQCSSTGELFCNPIGCPKLECAHPVLSPGKCCPECHNQCFYNGQHYEHGHEFWPKQCVRCFCSNGRMDCQFRRAEHCPVLSCTEQETPANQCCPVCTNIDHCAENNPCDRNAICENDTYGAKCKCKEVRVFHKASIPLSVLGFFRQRDTVLRRRRMHLGRKRERAARWLSIGNDVHKSAGCV